MKTSMVVQDRYKTTPFLLKLFYKSGSFHRLEEFQSTNSSHNAFSSHLQIYTWPSCSLRELTHLLYAALPNLFPRPMSGTRISFRLIFPDTRSSATTPIYTSKDLGSIGIGAPLGDSPVSRDEPSQTEYTSTMSQKEFIASNHKDRDDNEKSSKNHGTHRNSYTPSQSSDKPPVIGRQSSDEPSSISDKNYREEASPKGRNSDKKDTSLRSPAAKLAYELTGDVERTLGDARFIIGDFVACAIFPPVRDFGSRRS